MNFLFRIVLGFGLFIGSVAMAEAQPVVSTTKSTYTPYEHVIVTYSGVPTTGTEIVSVSKADDPDTIHPNMNFTNHRPSGKMDFDRFEPGTYEARIYFSSDNVVQARHQFTVASPAGVPRIGPQGDASDSMTVAPGHAVAANAPAAAGRMTAAIPGASEGPPAATINAISQACTGYRTVP